MSPRETPSFSVRSGAGGVVEPGYGGGSGRPGFFVAEPLLLDSHPPVGQEHEDAPGPSPEPRLLLVGRSRRRRAGSGGARARTT